MKLSILIVHHSTPGLLRQTLKGIFAFPPSHPFEVIVVDNNPACRIVDAVTVEFPLVRTLVSEYNRGFAGGMNYAFETSGGEYVLSFNPDMVVEHGVFDALIAYLDTHAETGIVAPQLRNPDGSVQFSCNRFMRPMDILYRRVPLLRNTKRAKEAMKQYLMSDWDHGTTAEVDYVLGAAMCIRRAHLNEIGFFDPAFYMYFEDQDLCRRFWEKGYKVVYHPHAVCKHYHRRETARGGFFRQITNPLTRLQTKSAMYYFRKYKHKPLPRA